MPDHARICWLILALACSAPPREQRPVRSHASADSAIYAILLDSLRPGREPAYVARTLYVPTDSGAEVARIAHWVAGQLPGADSALVAGVHTAAAGGGGDLRAILGKVDGLVWVDSVPLIPMGGPGHRSAGPRRTLSLSPIAFSSDSTRAAVYAGMGCGPLCGNGSYYFFRRDAAAVGGWRLVGRVLRVIS